ncbi:MAG: ATP-binding protein [Bacteroidia bacterium]
MSSIRDLIARGESQTLEFKFELNSARRISETISAFANTDGGTILVGVKDNGVPAGIRLEEELYVLEAATDIYCKPPVKSEIKRHEIDGRVIIEAYIPQASEKPVLSEYEPGIQKAWLRIGASNRLATPVHLRLWQIAGGKTPPPSQFSDNEQRILELFNQKKWLSLNQVSRLSKLPRFKVIHSLADFSRWEIIKCEPEISGGFIFTLQEESQ